MLDWSRAEIDQDRLRLVISYPRHALCSQQHPGVLQLTISMSALQHSAYSECMEKQQQENEGCLKARCSLRNKSRIMVWILGTEITAKNPEIRLFSRVQPVVPSGSKHSSFFQTPAESLSRCAYLPSPWTTLSSLHLKLSWCPPFPWQLIPHVVIPSSSGLSVLWSPLSEEVSGKVLHPLQECPGCGESREKVALTNLLENPYPPSSKFFSKGTDGT
ncbi:uncharacterized protein [Aphelocoma coerulescens]|uniref:uncharacterized protein isoform X2 n=1 Tax=Aphelocoma coerulescens TaxID=39617 RepID=UPI0036043CC0